MECFAVTASVYLHCGSYSMWRLRPGGGYSVSPVCEGPLLKRKAK